MKINKIIALIFFISLFIYSCHLIHYFNFDEDEDTTETTTNETTTTSTWDETSDTTTTSIGDETSDTTTTSIGDETLYTTTTIDETTTTSTSTTTTTINTNLFGIWISSSKDKVLFIYKNGEIELVNIDMTTLDCNIEKNIIVSCDDINVKYLDNSEYSYLFEDNYNKLTLTLPKSFIEVGSSVVFNKTSITDKIPYKFLGEWQCVLGNYNFFATVSENGIIIEDEIVTNNKTPTETLSDYDKIVIDDNIIMIKKDKDARIIKYESSGSDENISLYIKTLPTTLATLKRPTNIIYVSTDGDDTFGDGSRLAPYQTLGYAIRQISINIDKDTIYLAGNYNNELVEITTTLTIKGGFDQKNAWLRDNSNDMSVIEGGNIGSATSKPVGCITITLGSVTLENLCIKGANSIFDACGIYVASGGILTINNCDIAGVNNIYFSGGNFYGIYVDGGSVTINGDGKIIGVSNNANIIGSSPPSGPNSPSVYGIYNNGSIEINGGEIIGASSGATIKNCYRVCAIYNNSSCKITDGTIIGTEITAEDCYVYGVQNNSGIFTISGGTIIGISNADIKTNTTIPIFVAGIYNLIDSGSSSSNVTTFTISGGEIIGASGMVDITIVSLYGFNGVYGIYNKGLTASSLANVYISGCEIYGRDGIDVNVDADKLNALYKFNDYAKFYRDSGGEEATIQDTKGTGINYWSDPNNKINSTGLDEWDDP